jgi:hypothetical protein
MGRWLLGSLGLLCVLAACGTALQAQTPGASQATDTSSATVVLDAFSGRPNPVWPMALADAQAMVQQAQALPGALPEAFPNTLGYRGFEVTIASGNGQGKTTLRVYRQLVSVRDGTQERFYRDEQQALEQALIASAQPPLDEAMLRAIAWKK